MLVQQHEDDGQDDQNEGCYPGEESQTPLDDDDESTRQYIEALEQQNPGSKNVINIMNNNVIPGGPLGGMGVPGTGFGLNLGAIEKPDYQDEFMAKIDEFSESWRQQLRKEKRF